MKLGYPCINRSIGCAANRKFRLASYSEDKLVDTVTNNLDCMHKILKYNLDYDLFFFRLSSDTVPFASHPICDFDWVDHFRSELHEIGRFIIGNDMRISMHPDQFILLNSPDEGITQRSIAELEYHCKLLDAMGLDSTAKVQIHAGGVYKDRELAVERFVERYESLDSGLRKRLVVENDDRLYSLRDCLLINELCGIPVLFDSFHHECLNNRESFSSAMGDAASTWGKGDGVPMIDYSNQQPGARKGKHATSLDIGHFRDFLEEVREFDLDIMLEIKDKEKSALEAIVIMKELGLA
ncbi:UV DNA damage repair endonuclease UvsE [Methanococcoides methylutens]|uniref:Putative UV damage endonuclease n=1 Tax=Methanococcoides methylutens MM1 TaxID=1434104 RepID=A0A0E3WYV7_METMT|nr:UV DNA damage repair endonuclease UvsE [Methanococcoides methylutens]AKB84500.1 putative UV damage endonuclease [Methanococcoides methylutens MM1]